MSASRKSRERVRDRKRMARRCITPAGKAKSWFRATVTAGGMIKLGHSFQFQTGETDMLRFKLSPNQVSSKTSTFHRATARSRLESVVGLP